MYIAALIPLATIFLQANAMRTGRRGPIPNLWPSDTNQFDTIPVL